MPTIVPKIRPSLVPVASTRHFVSVRKHLGRRRENQVVARKHARRSIVSTDSGLSSEAPSGAPRRQPCIETPLLTSSISQKRLCLSPGRYVRKATLRQLGVQLTLVPTPNKEYLVLTVRSARRPAHGCKDDPTVNRQPNPTGGAAWVVFAAPRGRLEADLFGFVCQAFDGYFGAHARWAL